VQANQIGQVELLCLYGADVTCLDRNSEIPHDLAVKANFLQIADRLLELQFELTDEISFFLCNKRPDHKSCHFLIPDLLMESIPHQEEMSRSTKENLRELPDHLFDELTKDVYDELDRRQIELIWKCTVGPNLVNEPIPFLVIKSCFTQTRNQLRQKLARFNSNEFACLLIEILVETKWRYEQIDAATGGGKSSDLKTKNNNGKSHTNNDNDDFEEDEDGDENGEPLYDRVPSDEDYASVASEPSCPNPICTNLSESIGGAVGATLLMSKPKSPLKNAHLSSNQAWVMLYVSYNLKQRVYKNSQN
jgi:G protein-coupled receptor kinase interactor 2